jgi:cytochrome c5
MFTSKFACNRLSSVSRVSALHLAGLAVAFMLAGAALDANAQTEERSGKAVVEETCAGCHASGKNGAPKIGDEAAWKKRTAGGMTSLTKGALNGIRKMPPHGANMKLSDTEIKRAVAYMVNQSGGHWIEPTSKQKPAAKRTGQEIVQARCATCHETGKGGAPKIGDREAWIPRVKDGLDATVRSAINGHGGMPARGGMPSLSDGEMKEAIVYMMNKGTVPAPAK